MIQHFLDGLPSSFHSDLSNIEIFGALFGLKINMNKSLSDANIVTDLVVELDYPSLHISALEDVYINLALYKCFSLTHSLITHHSLTAMTGSLLGLL